MDFLVGEGQSDKKRPVLARLARAETSTRKTVAPVARALAVLMA